MKMNWRKALTSSARTTMICRKVCLAGVREATVILAEWSILGQN